MLTKAAERGGRGSGRAGLWVLVFALPASGECLAPERPIEADPDLFAKYRREILADYERFFSESSAFIDCLDQERGQAMADLVASVEEYQALFSTSGDSQAQASKTEDQ